MIQTLLIAGTILFGLVFLDAIDTLARKTLTGYQAVGVVVLGGLSLIASLSAAHTYIDLSTRGLLR